MQKCKTSCRATKPCDNPFSCQPRFPDALSPQAITSSVLKSPLSSEASHATCCSLLQSAARPGCVLGSGSLLCSGGATARLHAAWNTRLRREPWLKAAKRMLHAARPALLPQHVGARRDVNSVRRAAAGEGAWRQQRGCCLLSHRAEMLPTARQGRQAGKPQAAWAQRGSEGYRERPPTLSDFFRIRLPRGVPAELSKTQREYRAS